VYVNRPSAELHPAHLVHARQLHLVENGDEEVSDDEESKTGVNVIKQLQTTPVTN
jgi:hypothetical protein